MSISFDLASLVSKEIHLALYDLDTVDVSICRQNRNDFFNWKVKILVVSNSISFGVQRIIDPEFVLKACRFSIEILASQMAEEMVTKLRAEIEKHKTK